MMAPLVAVHVTATFAVSPALVNPTTMRSMASFGRSVRSLGETASQEAVLASGLVGGLEGSSHAASAVTTVRAQGNVVRERMRHPSVSIGGSTGVARERRAVASGLCVAGFRRVCLCRSPQKGGAIQPNNEKGRQRTRMHLESLAAGLAWRPLVADVPLALRHRLSTVLL